MASTTLSQKKYHFIGIGGVGMSGLAELLFNMGASVTGSDVQTNQHTERLSAMGVCIFVGHRAENVGHVDVVVYSSAIQLTNPEIQKARLGGIPLIPRVEVLTEVMRLKRGIAVGGSHGKTTTTSLLASVFIHAHTDPTVVVGGRLDLIKSTSKLGLGEWLIAEADESDGSFLKLSPEIAIVTNVDNDHLDYYKSFENLKSAFESFLAKIPFYGTAVACADDDVLFELSEKFEKKIWTYGFSSRSRFQLVEAERAWKLIDRMIQKEYLFQLQIPGRHNALNAAGVFVVSLAAGLEPEKIIEGLKAFQGVDRRFQKKGQTNSGIIVLDDYGHHPTEVKAVLQAMKEAYPTRRRVVSFQPHRYSRTKLCWQQFLDSFHDADVVFLNSIYPAGEAPLDGITSQRLVKELQHPNAVYVGSSQSATATICSNLMPNDVFMTLGAGDITKQSSAVLDMLDHSNARLEIKIKHDS